MYCLLVYCGCCKGFHAVQFFVRGYGRFILSSSRFNVTPKPGLSGTSTYPSFGSGSSLNRFPKKLTIESALGDMTRNSAKGQLG